MITKISVIFPPIVIYDLDLHNFINVGVILTDEITL